MRHVARRKRASVSCEPLETRTLLNAVPAGPEFVLNSTTAGDQNDAAIAADEAGNLVAVWMSGSTTSEIRARLFDANGQPRGPDFRVDNAADSEAIFPSVAMDGDGDFVVAWEEAGAVRFRRFDETGAPQGEETNAGGGDLAPSVAMNDAGDFAIATKAALANRIVVSAFDSNGRARGGASVGGVPFSQGVREGDVAIDAAGNLTVAWTEFSGNTDAYLQRFSPDGTPRSPAGRVFSASDIVPAAGRIDVDSNAQGDTVVVISTSVGIYARAFDPSGAPRGERIFAGDGFLSTHTGAVAVHEDGSFVVTFNRAPGVVTVAGGARARSFDATGKALGDEYVLSNLGLVTSVAATPDGGFVVAMSGPSSTPVLEGGDVYGRRFVPAAKPSAVDRVYVNGTDWSSSYRAFLDRTGAGSERFGYTAGGTPDPLPLPWGNIDQLTIVFNRDVRLEPEDLHIEGVTEPVYGYDEFEYDEERHAATWTFGIDVPADRMAARLDAPGFQYAFNLNVLPGDVDRSGRVNAIDMAAIRQRYRTSTSNNAFDRMTDPNGDGRVNALDLAVVRRGLNTALPARESAVAGLFSRVSVLS